MGIILQAIQARFRRPLAWPDTIRIGVKLGTVAEDRFTLEHRIWSEAQGAVVTEGHATVVVYDYHNNCKAPVPEEMRRRIAELEGTRK